MSISRLEVRPQQPAPEPLAYRLKDAARAVGVTPRHLQNFIRSGELPSSRIGAAVVVQRSDLLKFLQARRASPEDLIRRAAERRAKAERRTGGGA